MKAPFDMKPPVTAADCPPEWVEQRREVILREGRAVRSQASHAGIEVKSLTENLWFLLTLPGGALAFTDRTERDVVLEKLVGKAQS